MREILITENLRVLKRTGPGQPFLRHAHADLPAMTTIEVSEPEEVFYDHRVQKALPFDWEGEEFFILESDVDALRASFLRSNPTRMDRIN